MTINELQVKYEILFVSLTNLDFQLEFQISDGIYLHWVFMLS